MKTLFASKFSCKIPLPKFQLTKQVKSFLHIARASCCANHRHHVHSLAHRNISATRLMRQEAEIQWVKQHEQHQIVMSRARPDSWTPSMDTKGLSNICPGKVTWTDVIYATSLVKSLLRHTRSSALSNINLSWAAPEIAPRPTDVVLPLLRPL